MRSEIEQAVELLKSGEPESMDKALALLQETVFSFSMRVCQQREDAEDTMQEVLVKSVPLLSQGSHETKAGPWQTPAACSVSRYGRQ